MAAAKIKPRNRNHGIGMSRRGQTTVELAIGIGLVVTMTTLFLLIVVLFIQRVFLERTLYEATLCLSHSSVNECLAQYQLILSKVSFAGKGAAMDLKLIQRNSRLEGRLAFQQYGIQWYLYKQIVFPLKKR